MLKRWGGLTSAPSFKNIVGRKKVKYMNIIIKDTNYKIKYGYLVVSKSKIIPRVIKTMESIGSENVEPEFITELMSTVADMLLYGLQKAHASDFGFNFILGDGYDEKYAKVCDLIDDYIDGGGKMLDLFNLLAEELLDKGFLAEMSEKTEQTEKKENLSVVAPAENEN